MSTALLLQRKDLHARKARVAIHQLSYSDFVAAIGVTLTVAQAVIARVVYDRRELEPHQEEMAATIFGRVLRDIPPIAYDVFVAMCGGRGGKSYSLEALRILHLAFAVDLRTLAPGEVASGIIVSNDTRNARQTLRYVAGALRHPLLQGCVVGEAGVDRIVIERPHDGRHVAIECLPATAGGSAVRARSLIGAVMDEAAFFLGENHAVNDEDIFKAMRPRLLPGAQLIVASTPWLQAGLLFDLYTKNKANPIDAVAAHATTVLLRPDMAPVVAVERARDPDNARREFDAIPFSKGAGVFFDPTALQLATTEERIFPQEGDELISAADFAFRVNASTLAIGLRRGDVTWLLELLEVRPEPDHHLVPSEVAQAFGERLAYWGIDTVMADEFARDSVQEHLRTLRVGPRREPFPVSFLDAPSGNPGKTSVHLATKTAFADCKVQICPSPIRDRLLKQLKEIIAIPISGGTISIRSPQWRTGEHGDIASSAVLVISARSGVMVTKAMDQSASATIRRETEAHWATEQQRIDELHRDELLSRPWDDPYTEAMEALP
jgi:hypothetical protein